MRVLPDALSRGRTTVLAVLALVVLVGVVFGHAGGFGWVGYDDEGFTVANPHINRGLDARSWRWAWEVHGPSQYHPLTWLSFALDMTLFGRQAWGHHAVNIGLHAANASVVFLLLRAASGATWPAWFVAALFAVHPLRVESVVWIAERKDVLSLLLGLLALAAYGQYARRPGRQRYLLVVLLSMLAMLAKPVMVTLPVLMLVLDLWPLRRAVAAATAAALPPTPLRLVVEKLPLLALSAGESFLTVLAQLDEGAVRGLGHAPWWSRIEAAVNGVAWYLRKTAWPTDLGVLYTTPAFSAIETVSAVVVLAGITTVAVLVRRRRPFLAAGWSWFLTALLPVIGLVQAGDQWVADRYSYLPSIGLWAAIVWTAHTLLPRYRTVVVGVGAALLAAFAVAAARQVPVWRNGITLFTTTLQNNPTSWVVHNNLAALYRRLGAVDLANWHYRRALETKPDALVVRLNLAALLRAQGRIAEALSLLTSAPGWEHAPARQLLGGGQLLERLGDSETARRWYAAVLRREPGNPGAELGLGRLAAFPPAR